MSVDMSIWADRRSGVALLRPISGDRNPFVRDRARVIHSAAFRRLQAKTQVLGIGEGDFHRTRLTHSMEAAQIARGIVRALRYDLYKGDAEWKEFLPGLNIIETIALSHDLGHPPFGHGGEVALNFAMRNSGGFEGNGQTLRILSRLEAHTESHGLDLTRRCLFGVLKYPVPYERVVRMKLPDAPKHVYELNRDQWKPPKCYMATEGDVINWILLPFSEADRHRLVSLKKAPTNDDSGKSQFHGLDTGIMELGDDIAYGVHDFEDAIALRMVTKDDWMEVAKTMDPVWGKSVELYPARDIGEQLFGTNSSSRKRAIGALVNAFIVSVRVYEDEGFEHPFLRYQVALEKPAATLLSALKDLVVKKVIKTPQVQTLEYRGQQIILQLYEALFSDPKRLMKQNFGDLYASLTSDADKNRVICDYIAGMTDEYATRMYERLFVPRHGQFSDRL